MLKLTKLFFVIIISFVFTSCEYDCKKFYPMPMGDGLVAIVPYVGTCGGQLSFEDVRLKKTGQTKSYDVNGNEVAGSSIKDDGYYEKGVLPSYVRDDVKNTVLDNLTKLEWQDNVDAVRVMLPLVTRANYDNNDRRNTSGNTVSTYCNNLNLGGSSDWRLPTRSELASLIDYGHHNPAMSSVFGNVAYEQYWTSTFAFHSTRIGGSWAIYFSSGGQIPNLVEYNPGHVRCVRNTQ